MKKKKYILVIGALFLLSSLLTGCFNDDDKVSKVSDNTLINQQLDTFISSSKNNNPAGVESTLDDTVTEVAYYDGTEVKDSYSKNDYATNICEDVSELTAMDSNLKLELQNRVISISNDSATVNTSFYIGINVDGQLEEDASPVILTLIKKGDNWFINTFEWSEQ